MKHYLLTWQYHPNLHFYVLVIPNLNIAIFFIYCKSLFYLSFDPSNSLNPFDNICLFLVCLSPVVFALYPAKRLFYLFVVVIFLTNPPPKFILRTLFILNYLILSSKFPWFANFTLWLFFKPLCFYISGSWKFFCFIEFISTRLLRSF